MAATNPMLFINLPISDLAASITFYTAIGFRQNTKFSGAKAAMMSIGPSYFKDTCVPFPDAPSTINVMLLVQDFFKSFLRPDSRKIADAKAATGALFCLSADSREGVDKMTESAESVGGAVDVLHMQEMEGMYGRSFEDLDGHVWEVMWMDPEAATAEELPKEKKVE